jgi:hypothetical protein
MNSCPSVTTGMASQIPQVQERDWGQEQMRQEVKYHYIAAATELPLYIQFMHYSLEASNR